MILNSFKGYNNKFGIQVKKNEIEILYYNYKKDVKQASAEVVLLLS